MTAQSNEPMDGSQSPSSSQGSQLPWWRAPERILAVAVVGTLRWRGLIGEEWTALVLAAALGAPITQAIVGAWKSRSNGGKQ